MPGGETALYAAEEGMFPADFKLVFEWANLVRIHNKLTDKVSVLFVNYHRLLYS